MNLLVILFQCPKRNLQLLTVEFLKLYEIMFFDFFKVVFGKIGPTKFPQEKIVYPRNTYKKNFWIHKMPTRKYFGPTKYPRRHDGTVALDSQGPRWHPSRQIWHTQFYHDTIVLVYIFVYIYYTILYIYMYIYIYIYILCIKYIYYIYTYIYIYILSTCTCFVLPRTHQWCGSAG